MTGECEICRRELRRLQRSDRVLARYASLWVATITFMAALWMLSFGWKS